MTRKTLLMVFILATIISFAWSAPLVLAGRQTAVASSSTTSRLWLTVTSPNGGEVLTNGKNYRITWRSSSKIDKVSIGYKSCPTCKMNWIAVKIPNKGYYNWKVSIADPKVTRIKIHIIGHQTGIGLVRDSSDGYCRVARISTFTPTMTVIPTLTNSRTPTLTDSPTVTQTPFPTFSPMPTSTELVTPVTLVVPTVPTNTSSPTPIYTSTRTRTPTNTPNFLTPTRTSTITRTPTSTITPMPLCTSIYMDHIRFNYDDLEARVTNSGTATASIISTTITWSPSPLVGGKYFDYIQFAGTTSDPMANIINSPLYLTHNYSDFPIAGNGTQLIWIADFSDDIFVGDWSISLTFNISGAGLCAIKGSITTATPSAPSQTPTPTPTSTDWATPIPTYTSSPTPTYTPTRTPTKVPNPFTPTRTPTLCLDC